VLDIMIFKNISFHASLSVLHELYSDHNPILLEMEKVPTHSNCLPKKFTNATSTKCLDDNLPTFEYPILENLKFDDFAT
jgi:hypothetical protein